ncbi:Amine oxidase [flavin-containing] A [Wickerhamomyces ciferrii]|uniref:Amine oxidase n=1 Tax=Wickerhamomyces ciferrii (strain ATCC 14091 / BCRC 22168 / CBS 111 / JCM 3599 / NBRC 0793 / NRRL Y-1031 F-60-10) TaxID=1206466 RepID=K0K8Q4_WICCF|nr:Amine oxidase [flavin-containing] A [Wickerhamomyces ciferrii]CCH41220.1 Amine oxidase [flavin-containing] A [Wickerhamomyces ciferrii]
MASKAKVLIVGGGIAGIKAALELKANGVEFLILEAKDRLGGRLKTVQGKNTKYDLGASWFHETLNNPLFDEELHLPRSERINFHFDDMPIKIFDKNGEVPPTSRLEAIGEEITKYIELKCQEDLEGDKSVYESIIDYFRLKKELLTDDQIVHALGYQRCLELWHGVASNKLSSKYCDVENAGRNALALNYDHLLKRHTDQLLANDYILNKPVKSIKRTDNKTKVQVISTDSEEFVADYVIVAVPQSIIALDPKEKGGITFEPELPKTLTDALEKSHFGSLGKVVIEFEECFWGKDAERFVCLSEAPKDFVKSLEDKSIIPKFPGKDIPKTWEYPILFLNYATSLAKPSLVAFTQSPLTEYLESNPDKAWGYLKPLIQRISDKTDIPNPINQIVTEWTIDPYQRGAYTACFPGDDPISAMIAFEQGFGNVRFAGEHTILEGCGCVHGAWNSGKREANYIINCLNS